MSNIKTLENRLEREKKKLLKIGLVLQGSIYERKIKCELKKDLNPKTRGPYYQWTRKIDGKTRNINLSSGQAKHYKKAISENQKMLEIFDNLRRISLEILDISTEGVEKRAKRK